MALVRRNALEDSLADLFAQQEQKRLERIAAAWDAYDGDHPKNLKTRPGGPDDNLPVNFCSLVVDKGVSYLFGEDVRFEVVGSERNDDGEPSNPEAEAEEYLERVFRLNSKQALFKQFGVNGAVAGHSYMRIRPDALPDGSPRLILLDPSHVSVYWEPDDYQDVYRYRIQYVTESRDGRAIVFRQIVERAENRESWTITDYESTTAVQATQDAGAFLSIAASGWRQIAEEVWPYRFAPIVACQNLPAPNVYYGKSDLERDVVRLNYGFNALVSNALKIIRLHAHPRTVAKGLTSEQAGQLSNDPERLLALPRPDSDLYNLEMRSDLSSTIHLLERLREAFHEITRIPEVAVGRLENVGALSGVALKILYAPLIEKTEDKRLTYGAALIDLARRLLILEGYDEDSLEVTIHWPEVVPEDPNAEAQTGLLLQQLGVSKATILDRLGFDPDLEAIKRSEEAEEGAQRAQRFFDQGGASEEDEEVVVP